jgi:ABC-type multidrug transport system fused ATPase/permease subunit
MPTVARLITTLNTVRLASQGINALRKDYQDLHEWFPKADSQSVPAQLRRQVAFKDLIDLQNISFEYLPKNPVINDISIQIKKGQSIGIAGPSGAGKSTLIGILLGILKPSNGHILVDGVNLNPSLSAYERSIGLVPQHVFLADDTIKANIAFGIEPSKIDLKRISKALLDARLYEFVATLPEGIETLIGEQGVRLSGGQRQRLGIARALYDDPDILILDEATSSLDLETESKITDVMTSLHGTKTLVIIAHRLSTIQSCDEIYYMKDGGIAEKGTFLELTTKNEEFKRLVHLGQLQT